MPTVTVQPAGIQFVAAEGETIFAAARAAGYWWPTSCGGIGECTTCAGEIISGSDTLSPMARGEAAELVRQRGQRVLQTQTRLCCQARISGDVEVQKTGVKPW